MDHGFTAKQSNWILTRLEQGVGGGNLVSLEQFRAAVLPVLQVTLTMPGCYARDLPLPAVQDPNGVHSMSERMCGVCMYVCVRTSACERVGTNFAE